MAVSSKYYYQVHYIDTVCKPLKPIGMVYVKQLTILALHMGMCDLCHGETPLVLLNANRFRAHKQQQRKRIISSSSH